VFYGWLVVAAAFAITFFGFGSAYTFSAFVEPLEREFSASRGSVSLIFSVAGFIYFSLGAVSGPLADRWSSRRLAISGMALTGLGLALAGAAHSLTMVFVAYGLGVGLGLGFAFVPSLGAVQRWFVRRRGFASGIAVSGIGVGTLVIPPLASYLIGHYGWRPTFVIIGVITGVAGAAMSMLIESDPASRGLLPDGDVRPPNARSAPAAGATVREAIRTRRFLGLYAAGLLVSFGLFVPFVHLVPYAMDHGISKSIALALVAAIGIGSTVGRFFLGGFADRIGRKSGLLLMYAGLAVSFVIWAISGSVWPLALFAVLFGIFYGGLVALLPALVADYFGGRNISGIIGILYTSVGVGTLIGPSAAGFVYDATHSYLLPILLSAGGSVAAGVIVAVTGKDRA
jgi:MFS family permease